MTKTSSEAEKALLRALIHLKEDTKKQKEKNDRKTWSEIQVPLTLKDGLDRYTKSELDNIRKRLAIANASSLKKAELLELLMTKIPEYVKYVCLQLDSERFQILMKIARKGGYIPAPKMEDNQLRHLRETGFIYCGTLYEEKVLAMPNEVIDMFLTIENDLEVHATVKRNTEWIKLTNGLLYYYGTLSSMQLVRFVEQYSKHNIDIKQFFDIIENANSYKKGFYTSGYEFSNYRVFDPEQVLKEHRMRNDLEFYPFTKEQLLTAGEYDFVEKNKSYMQMVHFLTTNFEMGQTEADSLVEECVYATRIGHGPNEVLSFLSEILEFESMDTLKALMDKLVELMNNTREWFLKGHTSMELLPNKDVLPLPLNVDKKERKVGRNEPCPCGSGKKYKKCCGR